MSGEEALYLRGPWPPERVECHWHEEQFEAPPDAEDAADAAVAALRARGSPSHDGLSARLAAAEADGEVLRVELQPVRWALRLVEGYNSRSLSALCVVRDTDGRWLAGRRAPWVATWAGRWALGAGGSVDMGENPAHTLRRELHEEWSLEAEELEVEALLDRPDGLTLVVGMAVVPAGAEVVRDAEHDEWAWWPPAIEDWPVEADAPLRLMGSLLAG